MDIKIEVKQEDPLSDGIISQNEKEYFHEVVPIKTNSDDVVLDDVFAVAVKTEIKSETSITKHPVKQIKNEIVTFSNNWDIDGKAEIEERTLVSDLGPQNEGEFLSEDPVMADKNYNHDHEMDNKIEVKEEPWWLETEISSVCDKVEDGDFFPVKSLRLCKEAVPGTSSGKSPLPHAEVSDTSFCSQKYHLECELQKCEVTEVTDIKEHLLSEQSCIYSDEGERPLYLKQMSLIHESKKLQQCKSCDKSFTKLGHLKTHTLIHEDKKPHKCNTCDKRFTDLSNLEKHNLMHENRKPYQCKTCEKNFTYLSSLKVHNLVHESKRPHQCKICNKCFTQLGHLKTHTLIHEGKKPHQCKTCGKDFTQLSHLKIHHLIHEGRKPHKCRVCDKSFTHLSSLNKHYLIHEGRKPHQCKTCDKSFTYASNLKTHNLIHEGKKPHQCKTCDKRFTQLSSLKAHNLTHEGKKPHQCNTCHKSFTQLSHLKRHNLVHEDKK